MENYVGYLMASNFIILGEKIVFFVKIASGKYSS
jgi:hypothetical protein